MSRSYAAFPILASILSLSAQASNPASIFAPFSDAASRAAAMQKISDYAKGHGFMPNFGEVRSFRFWDEESGPGMKTTKAELKIGGVPVYGATIFLHTTTHGNETFTNSLPRATVDTLTPRVTEAEALKIAAIYSQNPLTGKPELRLMQNQERTALDLVWWVDFRSTDVGNPGSEVLINASTGAVMAEISKMHTAENKPKSVVYNAREGGFAMLLLIKEDAPKTKIKRLTPTSPEVVGCIVVDTKTRKKVQLTLPECEATVTGTNDYGANVCQIINGMDGSFFAITPENCELYSTDGVVTGTPDSSAQKAMMNSKIAYDYFAGRFGRMSFDGRGSTLRSVVKVGYQFSNAAWMSDLNFMVYGGGDGKVMRDFTQLLDVAGHEMTHGVVNTSARLAMTGESGAINEATADYFGLQLSGKNTWEVGTGIYIKNPLEGLRSLWNPGKYSDSYTNSAGEEVTAPNPAKYSERYRLDSQTICNETNDRCFVHMNSTIMSHGYFLIHRAIGKARTQNLIYRALTQYYRQNTSLREAGGLIRRSCATLYDETVCSKVDAALRTVEI